MSACVALRGSGYFFALSLLLAGCASGRSAEQAPRAGLAFEHPLRQSGSPSISLSARITVVESLTGPEDFEFVTVVLKTRIGQGARMVGRMVHVPVELLLEVPVVGGVADDQGAAFRR